MYSRGSVVLIESAISLGSGSLLTPLISLKSDQITKLQNTTHFLKIRPYHKTFEKHYSFP